MAGGRSAHSCSSLYHTFAQTSKVLKHFTYPFLMVNEQLSTVCEILEVTLGGGVQVEVGSIPTPVNSWDAVLRSRNWVNPCVLARSIHQQKCRASLVDSLRTKHQ